MKIIFRPIALLYIVYSYGCTQCQLQTPEILTSETKKISIRPDNMYLKIGDSTILRTELSNLDLDDMKFDWTAEFGRIKGDGNTVIYYAPDSVVLDIVEVTTTDTSNAKRGSIVRINVFRQLVILKADDMVFNANTSILHKWISFITYIKSKILKADDTIYNANTSIPPKWVSFITYIKSKGIKASIGVIGNSLEVGDKNYIDYLKSITASGNFELWNHGYDHILNMKYPYGKSYDEFHNTPYSYQYEHLSRTDSLAIKKLGIIFHTFGAPGNSIDSVTVRAIHNQKNLKVWLFGLPGSTKLTLQPLVRIEFPIFNPVYSRFVENYPSDKPYLVLQIHPNDWDETSFTEFKKIIDYLLAKKVTFITPYDYYLLMNPEK